MDIIRRSINGRNYQFYYLPSKKAIKILVRIVKIIGGGLGKGLSSVSEVKNLIDKDIDFGGLIEGLLNRIDEDIVLNLIDDLLQHIELEKNPGTDEFAKVDINLDFQGGKLGDLFSVLKEAIVINYSDFFGVASTAAKQVGAKPGKKEKK